MGGGGGQGHKRFCGLMVTQLVPPNKNRTFKEDTL